MRRARRLCKVSEVPTLARAVATAVEFSDYCAKRTPQVYLHDVSAVVLEAFVWDHTARTRVVSALRWLVKNVQVPWPIDDVEKPETTAKAVYGISGQQAPCAQPCMVLLLEERMEEAAKKGDPTWLALLGSYLQAIACLRIAHVKRSIPVKQHPLWIQLFCRKGQAAA